MFNVHVNVFYLVAFCLVVFIFGWWKGQRDAIKDFKDVREKLHAMDEQRRLSLDALRDELIAFGADVSSFTKLATDMYQAYDSDLQRSLRALNEDDLKLAEKFRWHACAWCGAFTSFGPHRLDANCWHPSACVHCMQARGPEVASFSLDRPPPRAGLRATGLVFPGWSCAHCRVFNGESKAPREDCRSCGVARIPSVAISTSAPSVLATGA